MIVTPRLLLRPFTLDDAQAFWDMNRDPQVLHYIGQPPIPSLAEAKAMMKKTALSDYANYGHGRLAVVHKADNKVIGFCGIKYLPEMDERELGYRLMPTYWRQGLATEAAAAVLADGHQRLALARIIALIHQDNLGSQGVARSIGMQQQGWRHYFGKDVMCFCSEQ